MTEDWTDPADLSFPERLEQLERFAKDAAKIKLDDLPMAELQRRLEQRWHPDATALLQENSVGAATLGDGTIVTDEAKLRMVRGEVAGGTGALVLGAGFTPARTGVGTYTVTVDTPFTVIPVVTVTPALGGAVVTGKTTTVLNIFTFNTATGGALDSNFDFIAIGAN